MTLTLEFESTGKLKEVSNCRDLKSALRNAKKGQTIELTKGEYECGSLELSKESKERPIIIIGCPKWAFSDPF